MSLIISGHRKCVTRRLKSTQGCCCMCDKAVEEDLYLLEYVPDWFIRQEQIDLWHDDCYDDDYYDYGMIEWYDGY